MFCMLSVIIFVILYSFTALAKSSFSEFQVREKNRKFTNNDCYINSVFSADLIFPHCAVSIFTRTVQ